MPVVCDRARRGRWLRVSRARMDPWTHVSLSERGAPPPPSGSGVLSALTELGFAERSRRGRAREPSQGSRLIALIERDNASPRRFPPPARQAPAGDFSMI